MKSLETFANLKKSMQMLGAPLGDYGATFISNTTEAINIVAFSLEVMTIENVDIKNCIFLMRDGSQHRIFKGEDSSKTIKMISNS